jgi:hypothetical protein
VAQKQIKGKSPVEILRKPSCRNTKVACLKTLWTSTAIVSANDSQRDVIIYISGYLVHKWLNGINCVTCKDVLSSDPVNCTFLDHKDFRDGALTRPNVMVVDAIEEAEKIFTSSGVGILCCSNITTELMRRSQHVPFPVCETHPELEDFFLRAFFVTRTHHACKLLTGELKDGKNCRKKKEKRLNIVARRVCKKSVTVRNCKT